MRSAKPIVIASAVSPSRRASHAHANVVVLGGSSKRRLVEVQPTYTLAQVLFALTAFFVAPAFGLAGLMLGARWVRPLARVLVPAVAVIAGLAFAGAMGMLLYPEYPYIGPPERYAAGLVLVGHLAGAVAVAWLVRLQRPDKDEGAPRPLWIASVVVWFGATFVAATFAFASVAPPRLALPDEATRVVEENTAEHMGSQYTYLLEADMSAEAYARYVERLSLPPASDAAGAAAAPGVTHELIQGNCGMRTHFDGVRMRLESWCQGPDQPPPSRTSDAT